MGSYSEGISKRIGQVKIQEGHCLICGFFKKLTEDHVPPRGSVIITKTEQRLICEVLGTSSEKIKGIVSKNGSKFKTICKDCNSSLSLGDSEIARVCRELTPMIKNYFQSGTDLFSTKYIKFDAVKYIRGMIGHILSATSVNECKSRPIATDYFTPLQNFVLGDDEAISNTHDIYYWFYPLKKHVSAKLVVFFNNGNICRMSLLSFFPIAFLLVEKGKGIFPAQAKELKISSTDLAIDLSQRNISYSSFPFAELKGNQFYLAEDAQCIVSYPIGQ
ncbi:hypothetical protein ACKC9G_13235 [Pokkaliibacter sp. CJK22405]|uniref:hypothetical protein n=1 Tax=Pokkaliibacter sp. CJK22405 TaxID=3384615 RepID=UPI0039852FD7